ncbi:hypothetical protein CSA37_11870 [Candidatus Fermentibacteria bacterium]|nr:MAG: hypothetical protein CSA37_11870 [Candidatus Fermentibacteria bacterium]
MKITLFCLIMLVFTSLAWDPLSSYYFSEVLPVTGADSDFSLGYFGFSQYWETDTLGFDSLYEHRKGYGVIRFMWNGRYGLTSSHTIGIAVPGFLQLSGPGDTTGVGIADPWIVLDGWMSRDPQFILRGALRPSLKGTFEAGDYSESDRHVAAEVSATVQMPLADRSSGPQMKFSGGLRNYFTAWGENPGAPGDSAETSPGMELRGGAMVILPVNRELDFNAGLEFAKRGETEVDSEDINGSEVSYIDLRSGITLNNSQLELTVDVFYRLSGENVNKEWGLMVSGIGMGLGDLFTTGSGGRSGSGTGSGSGSGRR